MRYTFFQSTPLREMSWCGRDILCLVDGSFHYSLIVLTSSSASVICEKWSPKPRCPCPVWGCSTIVVFSLSKGSARTLWNMKLFRNAHQIHTCVFVTWLSMLMTMYPKVWTISHPSMLRGNLSEHVNQVHCVYLFITMTQHIAILHLNQSSQQSWLSR